MNYHKIMQNGWPIAFQSPGTPSAQVCKMSELQSLPLFPPAFSNRGWNFHIPHFLWKLPPSFTTKQIFLCFSFFLLLQVQTISGKVVIPPVSGWIALCRQAEWRTMADHNKTQRTSLWISIHSSWKPMKENDWVFTSLVLVNSHHNINKLQCTHQSASRPFHTLQCLV